MKSAEKLLIILFAILVSVALLLPLSCGDDDDDDDDDSDAADDDDTEDDDDVADDDDAADDDDTTDDDDAVDDDDDEVDPNACGEFTFNLHNAPGGWVYFTFADMKTSITEPDTYDLKVGHLDDVAEDIDYFLLGSGVEAINLGNETSFADVAEAPEEGYAEDEEDNYVIGSGWQDGGSCPSGWDVTENVYVLHLADGTYAKFSVTSAQAGDFEIDAFRRNDSTRNLDCNMTEE